MSEQFVTTTKHFRKLLAAGYLLIVLLVGDVYKRQTFNTADGIATADNGAQTGELAMNLADGNLTSSIILSLIHI